MKQDFLFQDVKLFLESWGLHFDTPDGDSNDIPYPQVFTRMMADAFEEGGKKLAHFVNNITDTTDSRTYLKANSWREIEAAWANLDPRV
jgi:hypothetical protein